MITVVNFEDFLKTYPEETHERVILYQKVMRLRNVCGYGSKKIAKILNVSRHRVENWLYGHSVPRPLKATKKLSHLAFSLPLRLDKTAKFQLLIKLLAFSFGDGGIAENYRPYFTGMKKDLEFLKKEIESMLHLKCKIIDIHSNTKIGKRKVLGQSFSLSIQGNGTYSLGRLMVAAGAPMGGKVAKSFLLPKWITKSPKWVKKLFLEVLLGNELAAPKLDTSRKNSFSPIIFRMVKIKELRDSHRCFLNQLKELLNEFKIKTSGVKEDMERKERKDGKVSCPLYFYINKEMPNVLRFYKNFQLRYASQKQIIFEHSVEKAVKDLKKELTKIKLYEKTLKLSKNGLGCRRIARKLGIPQKRSMIDGWLRYSQKPEYFNKRKDLEILLKKN